MIEIEEGGPLNIHRICFSLHKWFYAESFKGHDPYLLQKFLGRYSESYYRYFPYPKLVFRLMRKITLPKALALIIRGNVCLYKTTGDSCYLEENNRLIQRLMDSVNKDFRYPCWGWPFRWLSLDLIFPESYPLAVVTSEIGHAFLDQYECTRNVSLLKICEGIGDFLTRENGYIEKDEMVCFYYSSLDKYLVHNTNVYSASFLARLSQYGDRNYSELIRKAVKFTLRHQNRDGSWYYWAPPFVEINRTIDNRHSGFTLVALKWINDIFESEEISDSISVGWKFYREKLYEGSAPKNGIDSLYPIDTHDIAQGIITSVELDDIRFAENIAKWAIRNISNGKDEFYYRKYNKTRVCKITFFRWTQAWMYRALALFLVRAHS